MSSGRDIRPSSSNVNSAAGVVDSAMIQRSWTIALDSTPTRVLRKQTSTRQQTSSGWLMNSAAIFILWLRCLQSDSLQRKFTPRTSVGTLCHILWSNWFLMSHYANMRSACNSIIERRMNPERATTSEALWRRRRLGLLQDHKSVGLEERGQWERKCHSDVQPIFP